LFRFTTLCALALVWFVWVEARWQPDVRTLTLRLRSGDEIRSMAFERARDWGREWVVSWQPQVPEVSGGPPDAVALSAEALGPRTEDVPELWPEERTQP